MLSVCIGNEDTPDSCGAVQSDLDRLEERAEKNFTNFTRGGTGRPVTGEE